MIKKMFTHYVFLLNSIVFTLFLYSQESPYFTPLTATIEFTIPFQGSSPTFHLTFSKSYAFMGFDEINYEVYDSPPSNEDVSIPAEHYIFTLAHGPFRQDVGAIEFTIFNNWIANLMENPSSKQERTGYIVELNIEKRYQHQGFASFLLKVVSQFLHYKGCSRIILDAYPEVSTNLDRLITLYERHNFAVHERYDTNPCMPEYHAMMTTNLSPKDRQIFDPIAARIILEEHRILQLHSQQCFAHH